MIDGAAICTFGGLILIPASYVVTIAPKWQKYRRAAGYGLWIGIALVLVGYFQLRHPPP